MTAVLAPCAASGCVMAAPTWDDYCRAHRVAVGDTCGWSRYGGYDNPPDYCEEDAVPGTERCAMHTDDVLGEDDEDGHDYWD